MTQIMQTNIDKYINDAFKYEKKNFRKQYRDFSKDDIELWTKLQKKNFKKGFIDYQDNQLND